MSFIVSIVAISLLLVRQDPSSKEIQRAIERLSSEKVEERAEAAQILKDMGKVARPALLNAAKSDDLERARRAERLLHIISLTETLTPRLRKAFPGIEERLATSDDRRWTEAFLEAVRKEKAGKKPGYPRFGTADLDPLILRALKGGKDRLEKKAIVSEAGRRLLRSAEPELRKILAGKPDLIGYRGMALYALVRINPTGSVEVMVKLLADPDAAVRKAASTGLYHLKAEHVISEVKRLLSHAKPEVRVTGIVTLQMFGRKADASFIAGGLTDSHPRVRVAALDALLWLDAKGEADRVAAGLADEYPYVAGTACKVLGKLGSQDNAPQLAETVKQGAPYAKYRSLEALITLSPSAAVQSARGALQDPDPGVRGLAAEILCREGVREAVSVLLKEARSDGVFYRFEAEFSNETVGVRQISLFPLNRIRDEDSWKRMEGRFEAEFKGTRGQIFEEIARAAGLGFAAPPDEFVKEHPNWGIEKGRTYRSVLEGLVTLRFEAVVEGKRLSVIPRKNALAHWTEWWSREEEKK